MTFKNGGAIWFWPTSIQNDPAVGVIAGGWINTDYYNYIDYVECPKPLTGTWKTDFGTLTLSQSGYLVTGTYTYHNGTLKGVLSHNTLIGRWNDSSVEGKFIFEFSPDRNSFQGRYGRGESEPSNSNPWNGTRIS
ncbi:hypothetical protein P4V64_24725 [Bacillus thuringiensis]|nr:hypothetical protein [Bacillus thuringiensis]